MKLSSSRVALAGCGSIARAHANAIGASGLVALCDPNLASAQRLRDEIGTPIPVFPSLEEALRGQNPDVVVVCTPPTTHFDLVRAALESGADDALALGELARHNNRTLRTAAKYRFCEGVQAAKTLTESGESGDLIEVRIAFGSAFDYANSWHSNPSLSGGGVWMDNGPHSLDLARYFAGDLKLVSLEEWRTCGPLELETEIGARFDSSLGAHVEIELSWERSLGDFARLRFARGILEIGWRETRWRENGQAPRVLAGAYDKSACFAGNWNGFLCNDARCQAEDGTRVVELLEAVFEAARR